MEHSFLINWGEVSGGVVFSEHWRIYAMWPAPVNEDQCFAEAGFNHFKYDDDSWSESHWDEQAEICQLRLISALSAVGAPVLISEPLNPKRSMLCFWQSREPQPLIEQLRLPILYDSLPEVTIRFGEVSVLQAGSGHELYWIGLRSDCQVNFEMLLEEVTRGWPVERVQLDWNRLGFDDLTWPGLEA